MVSMIDDCLDSTILYIFKREIVVWAFEGFNYQLKISTLKLFHIQE